MKKNKFSEQLLVALHNSVCRWLLISLVFNFVNLHSNAQKNIQVPGFEVLSRHSLNEKRPGMLSVGANSTVTTYKLEKGRNQYNVTVKGVTASIDGLSDIEYAEKADRIVVYGDSLEKHMASNAYVKFYTGAGLLIKSLGLVATWPYVAALSDNGLFLLAGNKSKGGATASMALFCYDKNGNKLWEKAIPDQVPTKIFVDRDNKYIALVLYDPAHLSGTIQYYNASGSLLFVNNDHTAVSGIEFLSSDKVVVCTGNIWYLYAMSAANKLLATGGLQGNALGKFPVSAYPSKDVFLMVTNDGPTRYRLQAYSASNGVLLAESVFGGEPSWEPYRLADVAADGTIKLITSREIVTLKMR